MGDFSILWCLPQLLSSVIYSFHCGGLSFPLLNLFLGILFFFFFEAIINGIVFLNCFLVYSLLIYRKITDFIYWFLYPAILLKAFMMSRDFWWNFKDISRTRSCHMQVGKIWLLPFLFEFHFISSSYLVALVRNYKTMFNKNGRLDTLVSFRGNGFSLYPFSMKLT
jgi:hypothetical protein